MTAKKALGKGLGALIIEAPEDGQKAVLEVDIMKIEPGRQQPRKNFNDERLRELADSINQHGVIQPLIVKKEDGGFYSIIAGERRYRAARMAQLTTIPVIVRDMGESETLQTALIENIQRQDLNPVEEAACFRRLIDDYFFTQEGVAEKLGKSRGYVSNALNLLNLDGRVLDMIAGERLNASHGRVLLAAKDADRQVKFAEEAAKNAMSAKELEELIIADAEKKKDARNNKSAPAVNKYRREEDDLETILGAKVSIKDGKSKGRIEIEYYSPDDLERLLTIFKSI